MNHLLARTNEARSLGGGISIASLVAGTELEGPAMTAAPLLTISVPTYQRINLLERCLASVTPTEVATPGMIELVISDNSLTSDTEALVERFSASWPSPLRYYRNPAGTGAVRNFNHCIERAKGKYNLMLHDDDYLLSGAIDAIVQTLQAADHARDRVLLFGVEDVDVSGNVVRRRRFRKDQFLSPPAALRRLLADSAFVRVPGLVVQNATYQEVEGFRVSAHTTCDFDMSVRLFSRFGVRCLPQVVAAYTTHPGAATVTVFTSQTIDLDLQIFEIARRTEVLDAATISRLQRRFFHQFILAGTWRALKDHDRSAARRVYALFDLPAVRAQGTSLRWLPVRTAFAVLSGALWRRRSRSSAAMGKANNGIRCPAAALPDGRPDATMTREW